MAFKSQKFEFVEVIIPAAVTATRFNFPDLPKLRYTSLLAMETYTNNDITSTPTGNTPISVTDLKNSFLVLYADERQDLYRIPLITLHRTQNSANDPFVRSMFEFVGQKVTWDKSYVEFATAPVGPISIPFAVYYV
jgi:hypothetical protein